MAVLLFAVGYVGSLDSLRGRERHVTTLTRGAGVEVHMHADGYELTTFSELLRKPLVHDVP